MLRHTYGVRVAGDDAKLRDVGQKFVAATDGKAAVRHYFAKFIGETRGGGVRGQHFAVRSAAGIGQRLEILFLFLDLLLHALDVLRFEPTLGFSLFISMPCEV